MCFAVSETLNYTIIFWRHHHEIQCCSAAQFVDPGAVGALPFLGGTQAMPLHEIDAESIGRLWEGGRIDRAKRAGIAIQPLTLCQGATAGRGLILPTSPPPKPNARDPQRVSRWYDGRHGVL